MSLEHVVQLFDTETSRAQNVAAFIARGLAAREPALLVLRPETSTAVIDQLHAARIAANDAIADGRLIVFDAEEMLRTICRNGLPDRTLFAKNLVPVARQLAGAGRLWASGEMVDILAQRGDLGSALMLEAFWNELAQRVPIMLMCSYASPHFVSTATHHALVDICRAHSHVPRHPEDPLGNWLLTAAHHSNGNGSMPRR